MHDTLNLTEKRAYHELCRGAPPVWLLSKTAGFFGFLPQRIRALAAMIAWLLLILIIVHAVWGGASFLAVFEPFTRMWILN